MKIGILTITPSIGFGGIMQAYALKYALEKLGHNVQVINYVPSRSIKSEILYFLKGVVNLLRGKYTKFSFQAELKYRSQNVIPFIEKYLNYSEKVTSNQQLKKLINSNYEAVIVGSDQVWRPQYVLGIENYYLEGVDSRIKRIAYAASFGVNIFEYTKEEAIRCSKLLKSFSYVSVREKSGVELVKTYLNYLGNVHCDLDPTLLVGTLAYERFISSPGQSTGRIFSYILDPTVDKENLVKRISNSLNLGVYSFNTNAENPKKGLEERVAPSVEEWLNGIYNAQFVVTDSFHGCVFSILFNKEFIVYVNKNRGAERFQSILSQLNLLDRMIYDEADFDSVILTKSIVWNKINIFFNAQRKDIVKRLMTVLD